MFEDIKYIPSGEGVFRKDREINDFNIIASKLL